MSSYEPGAIGRANNIPMNPAPVVCASVRLSVTFETASPMKRQCQFILKVIWRIFRTVKQKFAEIILVT